ncbi:MAG TPA: O-antigen ligase family protein [Opitutaceae bacterium]|nr:O-antigen ligase family protein [Opitutaceae bacterium]
MTPVPSHFSRLPSLLGWLLLAGLVLLSSIPKASTIVFTWPWAFYAQALMVTPFVLLAFARWKDPSKPGGAGLAGAATAGAIGVAVLASRQPHFSFEAALPLWGGLAWMFWIATTQRPRSDDPARFLRFARVVGAAMLLPLWISAIFYGRELAGLIAAAGTWRIELTNHRNWYPLGHWNYTGGLALLTLSWLAVLAWIERGWWRIVWGAGVLISIAVFFTASSRGAVLGALLGGAVAGLLWLAQHRPTRRQLMLIGAAAAVLAGGLLASNPRLLDLALHPGQALAPNEGDVQRLGMAQAGWLLGQQRPWLGQGPGMVPFVYPEVRAQLVGGVETSYQLHNGPLHWWVTTGLLGVFGAGWLGWSGVCALRRWQQSAPSTSRLFALASGCALVAYGGLALTDYQLDVIALVALLGLHGGIVLAAPLRSRPVGTAGGTFCWGAILPLSLVVASVGALLVLIPHWRAREAFWAALSRTPAEQRLQLAQRMLDAATLAPWCTHYRDSAGFQIARAATATNDPALRKLAREVLMDSLALDPAQEPVHAALGWLWLPDDPVPARAHFEAARRLLPDRPSNNLGLALACLAAEDPAGATQALALELLVAPAFVASPYWQQQPLLGYGDAAYTHWQELVARTLDDPQVPAWRLPTLRYGAAVVRWWREGIIPTQDDLAGASPEQRTFFATIAQATPAPSLLPQPYRAFAEALARPNEAPAILTPVLDPGSPALANALDRIATHPKDLAAFIRAPSPRHATLVRNAIERAHYPLMHRNLDGPGYADLAPYLDDPLGQFWAAQLLPPSGQSPGAMLQRLGIATAAGGNPRSHPPFQQGP